jgi:CRP-like cAMP-binding protein
MRENTAELLELSGYEVAVAEDGKQGIQKVDSFKPDLVICDVMMPELDGYGVLYVLSKNPATASIPFIFLTAKAEKSDFRKGMNLGADDYLSKPYEELELLNAVESRLKRHDIFKKEFAGTSEGLHQFIKEAEGLSVIQSLTEERKLYTYKSKEYLFREGDIANFLFFVSSGQVKTFKINDDAKELITEIVGPGDFLGYQPLLEERPYKEFASPMEAAEVYKIPKQQFLELVYNNREVSSRFIKMMSKNISEKENQLVQLAYDSVKKRIALRLKELFTDKESSVLEISRGDLANLVATSKETLVRTLSALKDDGIIDSDGFSIELLNEKGLDQLIKWS